MASEQVLDVVVRRHVFDSERPFQAVLDGIFGGIARPDIGPLLSELAASTSYEQFSSLVREAQGSAGLMLFLQLDLDTALALDPKARDQAGRRLVRLIAGNPVTMGQMTRHVPDAGSYAPVTILVRQTPGRNPRLPTTASPARLPRITTRPRRRSRGGSTPRCSGCCVGDRGARIRGNLSLRAPQPRSSEGAPPCP